jgi:hypothetical protein
MGSAAYAQPPSDNPAMSSMNKTLSTRGIRKPSFNAKTAIHKTAGRESSPHPAGAMSLYIVIVAYKNGTARQQLDANVEKDALAY